MPIEFKEANAVVLAPPYPQFNPIAASQGWLTGRLQVDLADPVQNAVHLPTVFNAPTRRFNLLVIPERIQLTTSAQWEEVWGEEGETVRQVVGGVVRLFPEVPSAIGLNFWWTVHSEGLRNSETSRRLFVADGSPFFGEFNVESACFGAYASKDFLGSRLKVDARPINELSGDAPPTRVLFSFNFHRDLTGDGRVASIDELLGQWRAAKEEASRIVQRVYTEAHL